MSGKKAYVSPQVIRVKLDPSQAVLSQCEMNQTSAKDGNAQDINSIQHSPGILLLSLCWIYPG